ncbi:hypothetical protein AHAS_Ahas01G0278500 [Arachis hypogaea]
MPEGVVAQNVHTSPNLCSYYVKSMLYKILIYVRRVHLIKQDFGLHLKRRKERGKNEGILSRVRDS